LNGAGTIEAWVQPSVLGRWGSVLAKGDVNNDGLHNYALELTSTNNVVCVVGNGSMPSSVRSVTTFTSTNQFVHIACTWDGATMKLYVNGVLDASAAQTVSPAVNTSPLYIGQYGGGSDFFTGVIDEARIYKTALTQAEIQTDMTTPIGSTTVSDTLAPTVPSGLSATAVSSSQINLSWTASTDNVGVAGYKVYAGGSQIATGITGTWYQDAGLAASTSYSYTVAAYDAGGNISAQSPSVLATTVSNSVSVASIAISPSSLNFGNQGINTTSAPQTVIVTNNGNQVLTISIGITGTNASDFSQTNNCGVSLAPSASCNVNVTFKPTWRGSRSASLTFSDNTPGSPHTVQLSGNGRRK
jgi:chitodextrinase